MFIPIDQILNIGNILILKEDVEGGGGIFLKETKFKIIEYNQHTFEYTFEDIDSKHRLIVYKNIRDGCVCYPSILKFELLHEEN